MIVTLFLTPVIHHLLDNTNNFMEYYFVFKSQETYLIMTMSRKAFFCYQHSSDLGPFLKLSPRHLSLGQPSKDLYGFDKLEIKPNLMQLKVN